MADKAQTVEANAADPAGTPAAAPATPAPRRGPGHRGADMRDTMAELAARAQEISLDAHSKIAGAMKDVIGAAAGLTGFAVESARDLVQYLVRRGQMSQEEADRVIRDAEEAAKSRRPAAPATSPAMANAAPASRGPAIRPFVAAEPTPSRPTAPPTPVRAASAPAAKVASKTAAAPAKSAAKSPAKPAAKSATKAAAKAPAKSAAKAPAKAAAKHAPGKREGKPAAKAPAKPAAKKAGAKKR